MDIFERLLKLFGKDYWQMSNFDLWVLAKKYNIVVLGFNVDEDDTGLLDDFRYGPTGDQREELIRKLVFRDKFASSFVAVLISLVALVISVLVAILK